MEVVKVEEKSPEEQPVIEADPEVEPTNLEEPKPEAPEPDQVESRRNEKE